MNEKDVKNKKTKNNVRKNNENSKNSKNSETAEKKPKNKASAQDFMLWLLSVLNEEACAEITGENEITVTDVFGSSFKLKVSV